MDLMLNITSNTDDNVKKKKEKVAHYSGSGFNFEFNEEKSVKAKVFGKKRATAPTEKPSIVDNFSFIENESKSKESPKKKNKFEDISIDDLLKKHVELPKQLPVVDFPDEPAKSHKKKKALKNTVDFAKQPVVKPNKVPEMKKKKVKFSKVSNPFPNEPSKKPENAKRIEKNQQQISSNKKQKASELSSLEDVKSQNANVFTTDSVDSLKIHPFSIKNLKEVLNFHKLTHVQQKSIPPALEGRDLLIRSVTGSGKTLTYALPIVEKLHNIKPNLTRSQGIHALVIVPTRELCIQTYEVFVKLVKPFTWLVPGYLSGGEKRKTEKARLRNGITILVTTPGRLCDHLIHTESLKLDNVQTFVLDEADRLLELGYENDVKKVVDTIAEQSKKGSKDVQKILLSATLTAKVKELAGLTLENPVFVDNVHSDKIINSMHESDSDIIIPTEIDQKYYMLPPRLRFIVLCSLLVQQMTRGVRKILIFFPTQHVVDFHYDILVEFLTQPFTKRPKTAQSYLNNDDDDIDGMLQEQEESDDDDEGNIWLPNATLFKLFGSMTQIERVSVFKEFKAAKSGVLLCTDVAARGIDVPQLDLVIQYSAPQEFCNYVHRIGRTARAGNKGSAIIFLTRNEDKFVDYLKEKNIEITEDDYTKCLQEVRLPNMNIRIYEEKVVKLQRKLEDLLSEDEELRMKASRAFTSWICYYKTFSKELRHMFNLREIHMGHIANNFGLRDAPKSIVKAHSKGDEVKKERNKNFDFTHRVHVPRGDQRSINKLKRKYGDFTKASFTASSKISEFDSGLPEMKKKRRK